MLSLFPPSSHLIITNIYVPYTKYSILLSVTECVQPSCMSVICWYWNLMMLLAVVTKDSYIGRDRSLSSIYSILVWWDLLLVFWVYTLEGNVFNPAFLVKMLPPFFGWHLILWMTKFWWGGSVLIMWERFSTYWPIRPTEWLGVTGAEPSQWSWRVSNEKN